MHCYANGQYNMVQIDRPFDSVNSCSAFVSFVLEDHRLRAQYEGDVADSESNLG